MIYIYPFITGGTVELKHYNISADIWQTEGYPYRNQDSAFGGGLGFSYRLNYLDIGLSLSVLFSSSASKWQYGYIGTGERIYHNMTHALMNYMLYIPVGLSYPISSKVFFYSGLKPIFGISRLSWYGSDSVYEGTQLTYWRVWDARLVASSFGLGLVLGGDILFSKNLGLYLRFGYDVINFKNYEGEAEVRDTRETKRYKPAYLVYYGVLGVSDSLPSGGKIPGEENLSGFRLDVGLKIGLGR